MNNQKKIQEKQNEINMLKCQYAAKMFFNKAEIETYIMLLLSISPIVTLIITSDNLFITTILPLLIGFVSCIIGKLINKHVTNGANLRNYFDFTVFGIQPSEYSSSQIESLRYIIAAECNKNKKKYNVQIHNTGCDNPPGVKDWYEFPVPNTTSAVFNCQKQNCFFTEEHFKKRFLISTITFFTIFAFAFLTYFIFNIDIIRIVCCYLTVFLKLFEYLHNNCKQRKIMQKIHTLMDTPEIEKNQEQVKHLQSLICEYRKIPVLEINRIHTKNAKKFSEAYKSIVNGSNTI